MHDDGVAAALRAAERHARRLRARDGAPWLALAAAALLGACGGPESPPAAQAQAQAPSCGRECLESFVDRYLSALAANDPSRVPIAAEAVFVENNQRLPLGAGSWQSVDGLGRYRHRFADVAASRAAAITVVEENGTPVILDLRLDVANGEITQIESLVIRDPDGARRYEERGEPHARFMEIVPADRRLPREQLVAVADSYLSGMQRNDPDGDYGFFHDDCDRWEHAQQTTNQDPEEYGHSTDTEFVTLSCREQFETGFLGFVTRIRDRRYVVVDEARQTVFGLVFLDHDGTIREIPLADGGTFVVPPYFSTPRTLEVGEAWRVEDGKLRQIEMTLTELPYGMRPALEASEAPPGGQRAGAAQGAEPFAADCGRPCLGDVAARFRDAVLAHDPARLPLARDAVYTENGQRLAPGDGLWGTLTEWREVELVAADPDAGTVVLAATHVETDVPGLVLARLEVVDGRLAAMETLVAREETAGERGGTLTLFAPRLEPAVDPARLAGLGARLGAVAAPAGPAAGRVARGYFAALHGDADAAVADTCMHAVNAGAPVTAAQAPEAPNAAACARLAETGLFEGVERARDRREWVVDREAGLAVDLALLDVGAAGAAASTGPYSILAAQLYAVDADGVRRAETVAIPVPYGMGSGW